MDVDFKITLYLCAHTDEKNMGKINRLLMEGNWDVFGYEIVHSGDYQELKGVSTSVKKRIKQRMVECEKFNYADFEAFSKDTPSWIPVFYFDIERNDPFRITLLKEINEVLLPNRDIFELVKKCSFEEYSEIMYDLTLRNYAIQELREKRIMETFDDKMTRFIEKHEYKKKTMKIFWMFGFSHFFFAQKLREKFEKVHIIFEDPYAYNEQYPQYGYGFDEFRYLKSSGTEISLNSDMWYQKLTEDFFRLFNSTESIEYMSVLESQFKYTELSEFIMRGVCKERKYYESDYKHALGVFESLKNFLNK